MSIISSRCHPDTRDAIIKVLRRRPSAVLLAPEVASQFGEIRDTNSIPALEALSAMIESLGLQNALLRHRVVCVFRCLPNKNAYDALSQILRDTFEYPLVRYKAVEALYALADVEGLDSSEYCNCMVLFKEFVKDPESIVVQSCEVCFRRLDFVGPEKPCFDVNTCLF